MFSQWQIRWMFLLPGKEAQPTALASCFEVEGNGRKDQSGGPTWSDLRIWDNVRLIPASLQSEFCILQNDDQRRQPILESLTAEVLESVEGLAEEEVNIEKSMGQPIHSRLFIFPAIVTNAEINVCHFDPSSIRVTDGTLSADDVKITAVPFIRFRKSLATTFPEGQFYQLEAANKARERTVFIVNAASIATFLKEWKMAPLSDFDGYAIQRLKLQRSLRRQTTNSIHPPMTETRKPHFKYHMVPPVKVFRPKRSIQRSIVAEIEANQSLFPANRELIARFEKKVQATLAHVWGEDDLTMAQD